MQRDFFFPHYLLFVVEQDKLQRGFSRFPHQQRFHFHPCFGVSVAGHVDPDLVDRAPAVAEVERETHGGRLDVGARASSVGGREAGLDEHGAETAAVVGGESGEDVED